MAVSYRESTTKGSRTTQVALEIIMIQEMRLQIINERKRSQQLWCRGPCVYGVNSVLARVRRGPVSVSFGSSPQRRESNEKLIKADSDWRGSDQAQSRYMSFSQADESTGSP